MRLSEILKPQDIKIPLDAKTKTDAIAELVNMLAANGQIGDPKKVLEAVLDRGQVLGRAAPMVDKPESTVLGANDVLARAVTLALAAVARFERGDPGEAGEPRPAGESAPGSLGFLASYIGSALPRLGGEALHGFACAADHRPGRAWRFVAPMTAEARTSRSGNAPARHSRENSRRAPGVIDDSKVPASRARGHDDVFSKRSTDSKWTNEASARPFWLLRRPLALREPPARVLAGR